MKFLKLDKKKGSGGPSIKSRFAYLLFIDDIDLFPTINEKGVRLEGDIVLKEDCTMMPLYLTSTSQEFSYDTLGDDDEKSYLVKFSGNHPGTELEALEFAKNMIEQPFLVLIPSCNESEPWKLLGEISNPLIFTSSHKAGKDSSKFTFNFEQRIGSEFIYFSYGGIVETVDCEGVEVPSGGFDPTKWARIDASNIDSHIAAWKEKLGINLPEDKVIQIGPVTATTTSIDLALFSTGENKFLKDGQILVKNVANHWDFPEVTSEKIFTIYVVNDAEIVHLALDGEEIPQGALIVAIITISENGISINDNKFKLKQESNWQNLEIKSNATPIILEMPSDVRGSFYLTKSLGVGVITIEGIKRLSSGTVAKDYMYGGRELLLFNATGGNIIINSSAATDPDSYFFSDRITPFTLKNDSGVLVKLRGDLIELLPSGSDPDLSPYALDADLDAEIVNRALEGANLQTQITANLNTRSAVVDKMHHYWDSTLGKWISSGLKFVAGAINQLEFSGRIKSDGLLINETTNSIQPQEIKFKDGRFRAALSDGIERSILLDGGAGLDFDGLVDTFFTDYVTWMKPATFNAASYQFYNIDRANISLAGASSQVVDNLYTSIQYTSATTTVARCNGAYILILTSNQGTTKIYREFSIDTTLSTQRVFVGYCSYWVSGSNPTNVAMSTLVNVVGICMESANPNILLVHNDTTGSATIVDTLIVHNVNNVYGFYLSQNYGETFLTVRLKIFNKITGVISYWNHSITSDFIPNGMWAAMWGVDSAGVSAVKFSDFGLIRTQRRKYL